MPYIEDIHDRKLWCRDNCFGVGVATAGELNYIFTKIINAYMQSGESYQNYNDVVGALEGCKLELYRIKIAPYEDKKRVENGDV